MAVDRRLLAGAAGAVAVVTWTAVWTGNGAAPATAPAAARQGSASATSDQTSPAQNPATTDVALELLERPRHAPVDLGRNPFRFRPAPAPPPPPVVERNPEPALIVPIGPVGPPPPPPIPLKFIGVVEKTDGLRIAVLSDGKRPISAREGEEIEGRYKIWKISEDSLEIAYLDGRGRQTLRLTGQ